MATEAQEFNTFNPSKKDIVGALTFFLGEPSDPVKLDSYGEHHAATYEYPDAFLGSNTRLRDTINNLVENNVQDWQTTVALPFQKLDGVTVEWDEIKFDVRLMQRVPYQGASRMQTSIRRSHRARVVRRGTAIIIESDFYRTERGRAYFADQVKGVRYCIQETCNFDVLYSLLTCEQYDFKYDLRKSLMPRRNLRQAMRHEINTFACVQKEGRGFDKAIEDAKARMMRYNVRPNMMILPVETELYITTFADDRLSFAKGGERAITTFEGGVAEFDAKSFRGLKLFTSTPFASPNDQESVQMLRRSTQVGEFYVMAPPEISQVNEALPSNYMDILIFDEAADDLKMISFTNALKQTCAPSIFTVAAGGYPTPTDWAAAKTNSPMGWCSMSDDDYKSVVGKMLNTIADPLSTKGIGQRTALVPLFRRVFGAANTGKLTEHLPTTVAAPAISAVVLDVAATSVEVAHAIINTLMHAEFTLAILSAPAIWDFIAVCVAQGIWMPIKLVLTRPFIEHEMLSSVVMVAGKDTGVTLFGPADMQLSANTTVKVIEGHYTGHFKSVVTKPENVLILRDIQCANYTAGANAEFFGNGTPGNVNQVQEDMSNRLEFAEEDYSKLKSMFAILCPYSKPSAYENGFSMTRVEIPWDASAQSSGVNYPGGSAMHTAVERLFHFNSEVLSGMAPTDMSDREYVRSGSYNNSFVFPGPWRSYNSFTTGKWQLHPGQGHFGADAVPGDARWRRGESVDQAAARQSVSGYGGGDGGFGSNGWL
jgi:hypothetical protein